MEHLFLLVKRERSRLYSLATGGVNPPKDEDMEILLIEL
jgi:hypothetical protein